MATILVVDDHPDNRRYLVKLLGYGCHRLLEAADGVEALQITRDERPDLILTDILMPTMDGLELVRRLHADSAFAPPAVIFCTATYREREARALAEECGVRHWICKPARPEVVLRVVAAALQEAGLAPPALRGPAGGEPEQPSAAVLLSRAAELEGVNARLAALVDLGRQLMLERDPVRLVVSYCQAARDLLCARCAAVGLLADEGGSLAPFIFCGLDAQIEVPPPAVAGLVARVLAERRPLRVRDLNAEPAAAVFLPPHPCWGSFLGVAIASSSRIYGLLYLIDKVGGDEFTVEDEELAVTLAAQIGVGYRAAHQYEEIQIHAARLEEEIAQRRQAEGALRESEVRYRILVEQLPAITYRTALQDGASDSYISPRVEAVLGFSQEEWMANPGLWFDCIHPDDLLAVLDASERLRRTDEPFQLEYRLLARDGRVVWLHDRTVIVRDELGRAQAVQGVALDVTERKQAEEALRQTQEFLTRLLENAPASIYVTSLDSRVRMVNRAWETLFRLPRETVIGRTPDQFLPAEIAGLFRDSTRQVVASEAPAVFEQDLDYAGGRISLHTVKFPLRDPAGRIEAVGGISLLVTERKQAEEARRRYAERLGVLRAVDRAILEAQSMEAIAQAVLRRVRDLAPCQRADIVLFDFDAGQIEVFAALNGEKSFLAPGTRLPLEAFGDLQSVQERFRHGKVEVVEDVRAFPQLCPTGTALVEEGIRALISVPLWWRGELIGFLHLMADAAGVFQGEHADIARELGDSLAVALGNARLLEQLRQSRERQQSLSRQLLAAQESERRRIARELHDEVGQTLTAIGMNLAGLKESLGGGHARLDESISLAYHTLQQVRDMSLDLRPTLLDVLGLEAALRWHLDRQAQRAGLLAHFTSNLAEERLPSELETVCFRIVQEALTNVVRHARARRVEVSVERLDGELTLLIRDDGAGFAVEEVRQRALHGGSVGLLGMEERATLAGGQLTIASAPGKGSTILARFHLPPARTEEG